MAGSQRLAKSLADLFGHAMANATTVTLPGVTAAKAKDREAFMEHIEKELGVTLRPLLQDAVDHPDTPSEVRPLLDAMATPGRQVDAIITLLATVVSAFSFAGAIAQPLIEEVGQNAWAGRPTKALSAAEAAAAVVRGEMTPADAHREGLRNGYSEDRLNMLVHITGNPPAPQELGEMLRRGIINAGEFAVGIAQGQTKTEWTDKLAALRFQPLPAAEAVNAAVQSALPRDEAAQLAELAGITRETFDVLYEVYGNPPGFGEAIELWRRGVFTEADVRKVIAESRTKTKYTDALLALRTDLPSRTEAIEGDVQGQLDHDTAVAKFVEAGGDPGDYDWLYGIVGNPIAVGQALELWNRQVITEADVDQVIRESRTKTKYIPLVKLLARRLPPLRETWRMVKGGVWTEAQARDNLHALGYSLDDATAIAASHAADARSADDEYAKGEVRALYRAELIDHAKAHDLLVALGKSADYADYMLALDDATKSRAKLDRNINVVRTKYLAFRIDEAEASETLDNIGVVAAAKQGYIDEWDALREATQKDLTEANVATLLRRGLITADDFVQRLMRMGYTEADAGLLLAITQPAAK